MTKKILVIGAGGAGLTAALSARQLGAEVTVVTKTNPGTATCTAYSAGLFSLACGNISPEAHYERVIKTGSGLNDTELVRTLSEEAEAVLKQLCEWGVHISFTDGRASARSTAPNELMGGGGFQKELVELASATGVKFECNSCARSVILTASAPHSAAGVETINWQTGKRKIIEADSVIIATGGAGQLYSNTDNPARMTGDGYAMAIKAGVELRDMEFVQFYPVGWNEPGFPKWMADVALGDYMRITDAAGDEFLKRALKEWGYKDGREANLYARDKCAVLMAEKERTGGVYAHLEDLTEEQWNDSHLQYCLTLNKTFFNSYKRPVRVAPLEHYFCGGIKTDKDCRTSVAGLYACGEAAGGVDGANRLGGNALANICTFGFRAGKASVSDKAAAQSAPLPPAEAIIKEAPGGSAPSERRRELQQHAWEAIGPVRSRKTIDSFISWLETFKFRTATVNSAAERLLLLEMDGLVLTAEAVAKAAFNRRESIGTHKITD